MTIGILTFQHSINFGAQLQCFALQETLIKIGHNVEVIQYYPFPYKPFYRDINLPKNGFKKAILYAFLKFLFATKMRLRFNLFKQERIHLSPPCFSETELATLTKRYDAIIVGSDQVWGPGFHHSKVFFMNWQPEFWGRRISYAPCCALNSIKVQYKEEVTRLIKKFDTISVRNYTTQQFVYDLAGIKVPIVLDPTFLSDFESFRHKVSNKSYILTYILGEEIEGGHKTVIENIKKKYGDIPVYSIILTENKPHYFRWSDKHIWTANPEEWVSFIKNASFFYTDSFHGVVFALKYRIPFLAYYAESLRAGRFIDLGNQLNIQSNIAKSVEDAINRNCFTSIINYDYVEQVIATEKAFSIKYLKEALS